MARANHSHYEGGPPCDLSTKKACDERFADWQAMQQVLLAYLIVSEGRAKQYKKDDTQFGQLVQYIAGERESITNADGNASEAPWVKRLMAAIERVIAGDLPVYNLVRLGK